MEATNMIPYFSLLLSYPHHDRRLVSLDDQRPPPEKNGQDLRNSFGYQQKRIPFLLLCILFIFLFMLFMWKRVANGGDDCPLLACVDSVDCPFSLRLFYLTSNLLCFYGFPLFFLESFLFPLFSRLFYLS